MTAEPILSLEARFPHREWCQKTTEGVAVTVWEKRQSNRGLGIARLSKFWNKQEIHDYRESRVPRDISSQHKSKIQQSEVNQAVKQQASKMLSILGRVLSNPVMSTQKARAAAWIQEDSWGLGGWHHHRPNNCWLTIPFTPRAPRSSGAHRSHEPYAV